MGLFRALIVIFIGFFISSMIDNPKSKLNNLPLLKTLFSKKIKENKCLVIILSIAIAEFIL